MRAESNPKENSPAVLESELVPEVIPSAPWRLTRVEPLAGFRLRVVFTDGRAGEVDMARLVHSPQAGVFAALADPSLFAQVALEYGAVTWPGEIGLAPDAMYEAIRQGGTWIV